MIVLSKDEIFKLGFAYGSFSLGEIDQGIHIILPCTDKGGVVENEAFSPLFAGYFDKIPSDFDTDRIGEVYMGAVEAFVTDNHLGLNIQENDSPIRSFERAVHGKGKQNV